MNVVIGSAFRNSGGYPILRYFQQVRSLIERLGAGHAVRVVAAEGDSTDNTRYELATVSMAFGVAVQVVDVTHGQPWFGSTEAPERMVHLSRVGNAIFEAVSESDDVLVYVESDLIWDSLTISQLIELAWNRSEGYDVISPLIFAGKHFYDIWGFRKNGERFVPFHPYHIGLAQEGVTEVDSVGSCLVMRAEVARSCRIRNDYCLVGWCEDAREKGYRIGAHANLWINHPA